MRCSLPALSRAIKQAKTARPEARPKDVLRLAEAARRDASRSWSRKTAAVLEVCVRNEPAAAATWDAVRTFAQLPPLESDVRALLPVLQQYARRAPPALLVVGDMAAAHGLLGTLSPEFLDAYLIHLASQNAFRAVQLWKTLPAQRKSTRTGILLYISANQTAKAESLVAGSPAVAPALIRKFIEYYARAQDASGVQRWVDRWQAPGPRDVNWLHHLVGADAALRTVRLPLPLDRATLFPVRRAVGKRLQHLVSAVNSVLAETPALFGDAAVHERWYDSINDPGRATLEALALAIAETRVQHDWTAVLKLVGFDTGLQISRLAGPQSPSAYAAVLSRAQTDADVTNVIEAMSVVPEALYTPKCLSALAQRSPAIFLELALPQDVLETVLTPHHLTALWRAGPADDVVEWLLPLTLRAVESVGLFRSACLTLLQRRRRHDVSRLMHEFLVARRLQLDARVLDSLAEARRGQTPTVQKLPKPRHSGLSDAEAEAAYEDAVRTLGLVEE